MRYQLVKYEGVVVEKNGDQHAAKETVVRESRDFEALYAERDELDAHPVSLRAVRHGVRPVAEVAKAAGV